MLLFADGDGFWTVKTAIDLIAVVGLVLTLFSIWLTWWLARRDLSNRIAAAQEESLLRIRLVIARADLGRVYWLLREARQGYHAGDLNRTLDRCEWAEYFLAQLQPIGTAGADERELIHKCEDDVRLVVRWVTKQLKGSPVEVEVSGLQLNRLGKALKRLTQLERLLEARIVGGEG